MSLNTSLSTETDLKNLVNIDKQGICIAHIAAVSANFCIGKDNDLPWHISADLQHFKRLTQGGVMVLGRKCYDSFGGKPLPKRSHWVVTRQKDWQSGFANTEATSVHTAHSISHALHSAIQEAKAKSLDTVWVIGGGVIYDATLPMVDRLELTHVHTHVNGDTFYPTLSEAFLEKFHISKQAVMTDPTSGLNFQFVSYKK